MLASSTSIYTYIYIYLYIQPHEGLKKRKEWLIAYLYARQPLPAPLGPDQIHTQVDRRFGSQAPVDGPGALLGRDGDNILQALDVDLVRGAVADEEVGQHALGHGVLVGDGALKGGAGEDDHGPQADGGLLAAELGEAAEGVGVEVQLEHVEELVAKGAGQGEAVGPLLAAAAEDEEGGVVLLGEELERGGVLEGVHGVLLGELLGERLPQLGQVGEGVLNNLATSRAAQKEGGLGVLDGLGGALLEGPLGAGVTGFSGGERGRRLVGRIPQKREEGGDG